MGIYETAGLHEAWAPRDSGMGSSNNWFPAIGAHRAVARAAIERMPLFWRGGKFGASSTARFSAHPDGAPLLGPAAVEKLLDVLRKCVRIAQGGGCGYYTLRSGCCRRMPRSI